MAAMMQLQVILRFFSFQNIKKLGGVCGGGGGGGGGFQFWNEANFEGFCNTQKKIFTCQSVS